MKSSWSDKDAQDFITKYAPKGVNADLAVRTYTTRLLGSDPKMVLHGGGNTSVKTTVKDQLGEDVDVICIKGSGWDMGVIEPAGLPAVRLEPLRSCASWTGCPTRKWSTSSASTCWIPPRPIRRSKPCCTPSCRTSSSTMSIPPPCWR
jgi:rhamnose utilization protein RhaD (predicted bifunctional aldolase and dehydrogenase)